jgi:formate dehydrogenase subunit gamma
MAKQHSVWNPTDARAIIAAEQHREGAMLPILHGLQGAFGYIPRDAEPLIAEALNLSRAEVHGVISFYHDFRREPAGRHVLKLCRAEACQSMGSDVTAQRLLDLLGLDWGETTPDGRITIEPVYCLGLCATAPSALFDDEPIGRADQQTLETLVMEAA